MEFPATSTPVYCLQGLALKVKFGLEFAPLVEYQYMADEVIVTGPTKDFESLKRIGDDGVEYWLARELMSPLGYTQWKNFEEVIKRAMQSCLNSSQYVENHFSDASKMVEIGSGTVREIKDWRRITRKFATRKTHKRS